MLSDKTMKIPDILTERIIEDTNRYLEWLETVTLLIDKNLRLAGPFQSPEYPIWPRFHDNFHYPLGLEKLLKLGFSGIKQMAWRNAVRFEGNEKRYFQLIHRVYLAVTRVVDLYARTAREENRRDLYRICRALSRRAPVTFREACQLYWFATIFRIGTATIGRIDQHLYPFYRNDLERGSMTREEARELLAELLYRFERRGNGLGDTLQNITLGGRNAVGKDETNELTYIILELSLENRYIEPKINVRLHKKTPEYLWELVSQLQLKGTGICTVFNDDAIIEGLVKYGRPAEIAAKYCADGCSEIILDGTGETVFRYIDCIKALEHTIFNGKENIPSKKRLQYYANTQDYIEIKSPVANGKKTGDFLTMETFETFYRAYLSQLKYQIDIILATPYNSDDNPMRLFTAATMPQVLEGSGEPYSNTACYHTYGLFIGSLGTAVNGIAAVKSLVYEKKLVTKEDLIVALRDNFENQPIMKQLCKDAPKFGNDNDYVDKLAVDIASKFASWVTAYKDRTGKPILPGLYNHLFHHSAYSVGATPDGRKFGDPVGEHISPTPGTADKGPTSIINSVCKINTSEQIFGSTLHLNIPLVSLKGIEEPQNILKHLVRVFCMKNGCVLNVNVLDSDKLLDAQKHPEKYKDLVVRVWGFSYYFTLLSKEMQDHVIARSKSA